MFGFIWYKGTRNVGCLG